MNHLLLSALCLAASAPSAAQAPQLPPLFHKAAAYLRPLASPPFSALSVRVADSIFAAFTLGGLDTLPTGEVLTPDGRVVPGLYAAGRNSAGLPRWAGGYSSGMSIGGGSFFGRLASRCTCFNASSP